MPLYEFECDECGDHFELIRRFSDPPVTACPACGGPVRKLLSAPAIRFKGSGWYVTDYAHKSHGAPPASESAGGNGKNAPPSGAGTKGADTAKASGESGSTAKSAPSSTSTSPAGAASK